MRVTYEEFRNAVDIIGLYRSQIKEDYDRMMKEISDANIPIYTLDTKLADVDMTVRLCNLIRCNLDISYFDATIRDIMFPTEYDSKKMRNFGRKSVDELMAIKELVIL